MLKLMYITNRPEVALVAEKAGVDRIFIDLEVLDKAKRQGGMDTVQSQHTLQDVAEMRKVLTKSQLLVRSNHIYEGSKGEIDTIIRNGADIVMLPYFKTVAEVETFLECVNGRAKTCLLVETPEAVEDLDKILALNGIDEIHIGLNDLHLGYGMKFMFELLADGTVERLADKIKTQNLPFGFGGIARIGQGALPAENIIIEHYRLGSTMVILSRSFCNLQRVCNLEEVKVIFKEGVAAIRAKEQEAQNAIGDSIYFTRNQQRVKCMVEEIVRNM